MPKQILFDDDSEEEVAIKTENAYAKKYDTWREKEEIHKLEQKYGPKALNSDASISSDSEDESDEPLEISDEIEEQFLKTLSLLKTKDPRIYDSSYKFFDEKQKEQVKEEKKKTLTFADSDDDEDDGGDIFSIEKKAEIVDDKKTIEKVEGSSNKIGKDAKLKDYLIGKADHIDDPVEKDLAPLKALWSDPKLNEGEAFLRDYILNKRYLEEGDVGEAVDKIRDDDDLEADEKMVEEQGKFERAYNFRFEEPDQEYLKRFPRTMSSIRPKDDKRSRKRAELRDRKEDEKKRKMEEIARLKALKLKEIKEKISKIKEVTGNEELAFKEEDIEGDFDPAEHDRRMQAIFDEEYYGTADDEKPVFPDLDEELEIENWDNYDPQTAEVEQADAEEPHCEDAEFNMDADYDPKQARANLLQEIQSTLGKKRRNRKKKSKLAKILAKEKPVFIPQMDKTYDEYMEEYYKMDCEDVIGGDLPTRFKYREVVPNDYGLTVEEILLADDKELTQWVPLKRLVRHKPESAQKSEVAAYRQKAADLGLKRRVLPSLFKELPEEPELVVPKEPKKKKKKKNKNKAENTEESIEENTGENALIENDTSEQDGEAANEVKDKKKKKDLNKKVKRENAAEKVNGVDNLESSKTADDTAKRKKKKKNIEETAKLEKNITVELETKTDSEELNLERSSNVSNVKKTKKKKTTSFEVENVLNVTPSQKSIGPVNMKRKLDNENYDSQIPNKKKKHKTRQGKKNKDAKKSVNLKDKFKNKQNDKSLDNPLSKLSDERLKAYGLNPKKYRSFLKYKKF